MYSIPGGSPNTMVPKYMEYFLIQRIGKLNRQQQQLKPTQVVFIAGDTLRHQPMGSWSHDCSSSADLLDSYPALVLYLAGVALHQQPMGSRSHDCSSYVGCGGIPCSILVSPNASLHKWQQAVAPGWLPYMVPQNWIQARTRIDESDAKILATVIYPKPERTPSIYVLRISHILNITWVSGK